MAPKKATEQPIANGPIEDERRKQIDFYREEVDPEEEITRPRCYSRPVQFLLDFKIRTLLKLFEDLGEGHPAGTMLVVCCGSGMESEMLARQATKIIALDFSMEAILRAKERAQRFGVNYDLVVGDAESLPFRPGSVEFALVHDGLHHLPDPYKGLSEMARVARRAVLVAEPADGVLTNLAIKLTVASHYEDAGNFVYRLRPERVIQVFKEFGFKGCKYTCNLIYYQPWTFKIYKLFERQPFYAIFRLVFGLTNLLVGRWGNSLRIVGAKPCKATALRRE